MTNEAPLVVVVDDDPSMRQALDRLLTAAGFRVRGFGSPDALRACDGDDAADCLVLDVRMPGEDGPAYYASLPPTRPPAVFISAHDAPASRERAIAAGAAAFMAKPFDGPAFLASVAGAIESGRPGSRGAIGHQRVHSHGFEGENG